MILEVAILDVKSGMEKDFETSFNEAQFIIPSLHGYISHQLQKCVEKKNRYILLVNWEALEDHTVGFRESPQYQQWKALLHHYYDPFPTVEHYQLIAKNKVKA
ncbi:MAG: antibiotic biosynthesis monooxygenase [Cocleimonas sp.]